MASYQTLFTLAVEHAYFADGLWPDLHFTPDQSTAKVIANGDLLLLRTKQGVGMYFDPDKLPVLRLYAADNAGKLRFRLHAQARDRSFETYTNPAFRRDSQVLLFTDAGEWADASGGEISLGMGEVVSEADFAAIAHLVGKGFLDARQARVPPDFIVDVAVPLGGEQAGAAPAYRIRFETRVAYWKYYLLGNMRRDQAFIVDLDGKIEFLPCGDAVVAGDKTATVFRSAVRVPLSQRSGERFQLREQVHGVTKTLLKRLPVASESRLGRDVIDGSAEVVLECFVNF